MNTTRLNPTILLRYIGMKLGISHAVLEVSNEFILRVVRMETLNLFSKYYPFVRRVMLNADRDKADEKRVNYLRIPPEKIDPGSIRTILKVIPDSYWMSRENYIPMNTNMFQWQLETDFVSSQVLQTTFFFYPPNIIDLAPKNTYYKNVLLEVAVNHHENFFTIPPQLIDIFKELALIDVKEAIYNIRVNFPNLNTVFGSIDLNMDLFSGMTDKRDELISKIKTNYYKSAIRKRIFTG